MHIKYAILTSFVPLKSGIATFCNDLYQSLNIDKQYNIEIIAVESQDNKSDYTSEVRHIIKRNSKENYLELATTLNDKYDLLLIQHKFGLFGDNAGNNLIDLLKNVRIPKVATCHTILNNPNDLYRDVFLNMAKYLDKFIAMTLKASSLLQEVYNIDQSKIEVIAHGGPKLPLRTSLESKALLGIPRSTITLATFGLLSPSKGLDTIIRAVAKVKNIYPDISYYILGQIHPNEQKNNGDAYLNYLKGQVIKYDVKENIEFMTKFMEAEELYDNVNMADIYVIPYPNRDQISSGTLSYALSAGKAIISTPFWHAQEVLSNGLGLFAYDDQSFAQQIVSLISNDDKRLEMEKRVYAYAEKLTWDHIGIQYNTLFNTLLTTTKPRHA
ncbi:hypothetical protein DID80_04830 [Candidatus Marinamargulisbacteria bacterium SCGC AAA071-K20]|nr:hypothetical protein DID80_04830 [Candidatus Marinamargulisbacteria bacterium SCGC AAA071-K20]